MVMLLHRHQVEKKIGIFKELEESQCCRNRNHPDHCMNNIFESDMLGLSKKS